MLLQRLPRARQARWLRGAACGAVLPRYDFLVIGGYWGYFVEWIPNNFKNSRVLFLAVLLVG